MAWVRIEDHVFEHPKMLKAGPAACWFWVCGLAYCQRQLSDGFVPKVSLKCLYPVLQPYQFRRLAARLVSVGLWEVAPDGYKVHDYHDYNDTREKALERKQLLSKTRSDAGKNGAKSRWQTDSKPIANGISKRIAPSPTPTPVPVLKKEQVGGVATTARSKRPIFSGQRLAVFEWMFDDLCRMLGAFTDEFDLHEWFFTADARALAETVVVSDWWPWLKAQTLEEAQRRGLPIAVAEPPARTNTLTARMAAMVAKSRAEAG